MQVLAEARKLIKTKEITLRTVAVSEAVPQATVSKPQQRLRTPLLPLKIRPYLIASHNKRCALMELQPGSPPLMTPTAVYPLQSSVDQTLLPLVQSQPSVMRRHTWPLLPRCNLPLHRAFTARHSVVTLRSETTRGTTVAAIAVGLSKDDIKLLLRSMEKWLSTSRSTKLKNFPVPNDWFPSMQWYFNSSTPNARRWLRPPIPT